MSEPQLLALGESTRLAAEVEALFRDSCERISVKREARRKTPLVREIVLLLIELESPWLTNPKV